MISPEEIRKQALKWWKPLLQSTISGEAFFPKTIDRIGKVRPGHITQRFEGLQQEIEALYRHSKNQAGVGYQVKTTAHHFRRTGSHELPDAVVFETLEDYLQFTGKKKAWLLFLSNYKAITQSIPGLSAWAFEHCLRLTETRIDWTGILGVCRYFLENPRPGLYVRQLPVTADTKFIEDNEALIRSLLDFLIPDDIRSPHQKRFAERYYLRYDEPLIRIRILDPHLLCFGNAHDISIPLSDFERLDLPAKHVLIAENKMNFLTLPPVEATVAVWSGGGFNISYLSSAGWLAEKAVFYWGDIDEHGFQILHQLRSYYPDTKSIMMDSDTFERFAGFAVAGARNRAEDLSGLDREERELFTRLKRLEKNRLEQEKIPQVYAEEYIKKKISS